MNDQTKAVVSVAEMARMIGLSRQRLYQLMGTTFPHPLYDVTTKRPFYPKELQQICLEVRSRNCGIDGKPVLFYAKGHRKQQRRLRQKTKRPAQKHEFAGIVDGLTALGLSSVSNDQVATAIKEIFPSGINGDDQAEVLRAVFLHLKRQDSGDNVRR
jgi:hypothetical protein